MHHVWLFFNQKQWHKTKNPPWIQSKLSIFAKMGPDKNNIESQCDGRRSNYAISHQNFSTEL